MKPQRKKMSRAIKLEEWIEMMQPLLEEEKLAEVELPPRLNSTFSISASC